MALFDLLISSLHFEGDYLFFEWFIGITILSIPLFAFVKRRTSLTCGLFFLYWFLLCDAMILYHHNDYFLTGEWREAFIKHTGVNTFVVLTMVFSLFLVSRATLLSHLRALPLYGAINASYIILSYCIKEFCFFFFNHGYLWVWNHLPTKFLTGLFIQPSGWGSVGTSGFIDYSGMNGVLIVLCMLQSVYSLIEKRNKKDLLIVSTSTIGLILSKSAIPWGVLACGVAGFLITSRRLEWKYAFIILVIVLFGASTKPKSLLDGSGRFEAYKIFISAWIDAKKWVFGTAPGSFPVLSRIVQINRHFMVNPDGSIWVWPWAHSEPIQMFLEMGVIGLILSLGTYFEVLYKLFKRKNASMVGLMCGAGASALLDYPLRNFLTAFLVSLFVVLSYSCINENKNTCLEKTI